MDDRPQQLRECRVIIGLGLLDVGRGVDAINNGTVGIRRAGGGIIILAFVIVLSRALWHTFRDLLERVWGREAERREKQPPEEPSTFDLLCVLRAF